MPAALAGVLLAAGRGRRFDPSGARLKLLAAAASGPHAGAPLAVAAARTLVSVLPRVVAVVRPADSAPQRQLQQLLREEGCEVTVCDDADAGMGVSLACGIAAACDAGGWIVALADMPAIQAGSVQAIMQALQAGATTAAPAWHGARGHPVGFAASLRDELLLLRGDVGARDVLLRHPPRLIALDDPGILIDIDHEE